MQHMELWKLGADLLLLLSLVWLGVRFLSTPGNSQRREMAELESSLRALIKEADTAGNTLNDQLLRRQQSLERILGDLSATEQRIALSVSSAEEMKRNLEGDLQRAGARVHAQVSRPPEQPVSQYAAPQVFHARPPSPPAVPQPPTFEMASKPLPAAATKTTTNIFGGEISQGPATPPRAYNRATERYAQTLAGKVKKEVIPNQLPAPVRPPPQKSQEDTMHEVYSAAERLLKAGKDLQTVSLQTKLPIDDVAYLSKLLGASEKAAAVPPLPFEEAKFAQQPSEVIDVPEARGADPRLGVLSGIKRQVQIL